MVGSFFETSFFVGNRMRLRQLFTGSAPIIITANGQLQRSGDTTFEYRQDSNFWYLTGINEQDVVLVIDKEREYLIVPSVSEQRAVFDGQTDVIKLAARAGIQTIYEEDAGWKYLSKKLKRVKHFATLGTGDSFYTSHGFYLNPARRRLTERIQGYNPDIELIDLRSALLQMRVVKQPQELRAIRRAILLSSQALKFARHNLQTMQNEYQIEAELTKQVRYRGAKLAYQPIVASDINACTLHYLRNNAPLGKSVLIDFGAEVENYAADISRTYSMGKPSGRLLSVHQAVLEVHKKALSWLAPGVVLKDYEERVVQLMGEKLRELGLIKTINKKNVRVYYPHSTSHFLGLDVHDVGFYDKPLESNMVLTVEPGIYIPKEGIGVRIEDDILITPTGSKNLSAALPSSLY